MSHNEETIGHAEGAIGHRFADTLLCAEAVTMSGPTQGFRVNGKVVYVSNNQRLAILGDIILTKVLCDHWFDSPSGQNQAVASASWNAIRQDITSKENLAKRGNLAGLRDCIVVSPGTPNASDKMVATAVQALIGAVYKDGGDNAVNTVIAHLGLNIHHHLISFMNHLTYLFEAGRSGLLEMLQARRTYFASSRV